MGDLLNKHIDQEGYGLSYNLWKNFPKNEILSFQDRNVGYEFFDDFEKYHPTTLESGYTMLATSGSIVQSACTGNTATTGLGLVTATTNGSAADELLLCRGSGLSAPYKLTGTDVCFEARFTVSSITAVKYSMFVGLSEIAAGTTDHLFANDGSVANYNMIGFQKMVAKGAAWDGQYKADGQTAVDGAVNTDLYSLHTMVAATFVKVGFHFDASANCVRFYVNGVEKAKVTNSDVSAATFPDDVFMTPVVGLMDVAGDAVVGWTLDWLACAQAL